MSLLFFLVCLMTAVHTCPPSHRLLCPSSTTYQFVHDRAFVQIFIGLTLQYGQLLFCGRSLIPVVTVLRQRRPSELQYRFSEVYVPELEDRLDLKQVVDGYISGVAIDHESLAFTAVDLYLWARGLSTESLSDGAGQRPRYSLR